MRERENHEKGISVRCPFVCARRLRCGRQPCVGCRPSIRRSSRPSWTANDGDTVLVSPGVYYETINFSGKNITVTSTDPNDRGIVGYTILNADGDGTVVTFENRETNKAVLTGFTITGGVGTLMYEWDDGYYKQKQFCGGGIYCRNASPTITRCVITRNHGPYSQTDDGATYESIYSTAAASTAAAGPSSLTTRSTTTRRTMAAASMLPAPPPSPTISSTTTPPAMAGACTCTSAISSTTRSSTTTSAKRPNGARGATSSRTSDYSPTAVVANNIICGAKSGGGLFHYQAVDGAIRFNNVWDNTPANYGMEDPRTYDTIYDGIADWTGRFGNISVDPRFRNSSDERFSPSGGLSLHRGGRSELSAGPDCQGYRRRSSRVRPAGGYGRRRIHRLRKASGQCRSRPARACPGSDHAGCRRQLLLRPQRRQDLPMAANPGHVRSNSAMPRPRSPRSRRRPRGGMSSSWSSATASTTSKPDRVLVVVGNEAPVANAGPDSLWQVPGTVILDGSRSQRCRPAGCAYLYLEADRRSAGGIVSDRSGTGRTAPGRAGTARIDLEQSGTG